MSACSRRHCDNRLRARGYGVARPDAVKQTVSSSGGHFSEWVPSNRWQETG
jgi:hypothetical protein